MQKIVEESKVKEVSEPTLRETVALLATAIARLEERMERRMDAMEERMERRMDSMEERMDAMERRISREVRSVKRWVLREVLGLGDVIAEANDELQGQILEIVEAQTAPGTSPNQIFES